MPTWSSKKETDTRQARYQHDALRMEAVRCCICEGDDAEVIGMGQDFEYATSADTFPVVQCRRCGLVYLNPRPSLDELPRIYPPHYYAYQFSEAQFGFVYRVRRRLEARRLLSCCRGLRDHARILDVGCGDGFHLGLLRDFGNPTWQLEGVDASDRAVEAATAAGLRVHKGFLQALDLPHNAYDLVFLIATIEHIDDPQGLLEAIRCLLRPGGRLVVVTDNTEPLQHFTFLRQRHWGGYHCPRHWTLFNPNTMRALAHKVGLEVESLGTVVSPVNWVYSIHNFLTDHQAPQWLVRRFSLASPVSLAVFTVFDIVYGRLTGKGALLRAVLQRPGL